MIVLKFEVLSWWCAGAASCCFASLPALDHGKTTLVDKLLQACSTEGSDGGGVDRLLDR